ncbi:MAG TPA: hypothetical protein VIJ27_09395 [Mucilaginibacter sp.]|jgi:hypothetical protein
MDEGQPLLEKLEELFGNEPFDAVEEELFKWFQYAYTGKGSSIKDLDTLNFELFKARLTVLINAVYQWRQEEKLK